MPMAVSASSVVSGAPNDTMEKKDAAAPPPTSSSWEDMEYGGLQLPAGIGPLPDGVLVKNTFIECPNARSISLDEEAEAQRGWKSCPNSGIMMGEAPVPPGVSEMQSLVIPEGVESASASSTRGDSEGLEKEPGELPDGLILKNTFIDYPTERSSSLDEYFDEKGWKSCPVSRMQSEVENQVSEIQAAVIAEGKEDEASRSGSERGEEPEDEKTTLRLLELLPRPVPVVSVGSLPHQLGQICKPCGFVHKPEGCSNGASCQYCHLCPPGTIKQRKKVKKAVMGQARAFNRTAPWNLPPHLRSPGTVPQDTPVSLMGQSWQEQPQPMQQSQLGHPFQQRGPHHVWL